MRAAHRTSARQWALYWHRYAGLLTAVFLAFAGLTGSLIAFADELDAWLNPAFYQAQHQGQPLTARQLAAQVEQDDPRLRVTLLPAIPQVGKSAELRVVPRDENSPALGFDRLYVDPVSATVLGRRQQVACCFAREQLVPFVYYAHYSLLAGDTGELVMGLVALVWLIDSVLAVWLTLPRRAPIWQRAFWSKWRTAWQIKPRAGAIRRTLDLHRAGSLWLWSTLLALAFTSLYFNLRAPLYTPLVNWFSPLTPSVFEQRAGQVHPPEAALLNFDRAVDLAEQEAQRRGWSLRPTRVFYIPPSGVFGVSFEKSPNAWGLRGSIIYLDDQDGRVVQVQAPDSGSAGDLFTQWMFPLHSGQIAGLTGRIFILLCGLAVCMLSVTGVLIWWKKRTARGHRRQP
ncbi:MAG: PepSY-associated TM helix domain-containing protein [Pseudomonas sp.]